MPKYKGLVRHGDGAKITIYKKFLHPRATFFCEGIQIHPQWMMCSTTPLTVLDMRRNSFPSLDVRTSENNGQTNTKSQSQQTLPDVDSQTRSTPDTDRQIEQTKTKYELLTIQTISNRNDTTQSKQTQIDKTTVSLASSQMQTSEHQRSGINDDGEGRRRGNVTVDNDLELGLVGTLCSNSQI